MINLYNKSIRTIVMCNFVDGFSLCGSKCGFKDTNFYYCIVDFPEDFLVHLIFWYDIVLGVYVVAPCYE